MQESSSNQQQIQIRLLTEEQDYAVPKTELSIPATIDQVGLNNLVRGLIREGRNEKRDISYLIPEFSFVCLGDFILEPFNSFLSKKDGISVSESVFDVFYFQSSESPDPYRSQTHDDWIASVSGLPEHEYVLSGCYDGTVTIWNAEKDEKLITIPGHSGPVKAVSWIKFEDGIGTFASASHDQIVNLYRWNVTDNAVDSVNACKGHERSVDCLDIIGSKMATGSFDNNLKIWSCNLESRNDESEEKRKSSAVTRTPLTTLAGHKEGISGIAFGESEREVISASWDHTVKLWDLEVCGMKSEFVGNKSFFAISRSPITGQLLTASADRFIRMYDPRSSEESIVKNTYSSHKGWVTCVKWSKNKEHYFVSGSHDQILKVWDDRSYKTPMYDFSGHSDKILCCDWSNLNYILSGGADNDMKIFKSNVKE